MKLKNLRFSFSTKDPEFKTKEVIVQDQPQFISHAFVKCPIYDLTNSEEKKIGFKVSDDYVQQTAENKFVVRLNNTYTFDEDGSSISWQYVFVNDKPLFYYPVGVPAISNIIAGTGKYVGAKGTVTLLPRKDGKRIVNIRFNN
jgi:hypothetical protein